MTSLHTKHRPLRFEDVLGQETIVKSLKRVLADGRAKAFIFTGPSGTGKTTLARILANEFAGRVATVANIEEFPAAEKSGVDDVRAVVNRTIYRAIGESPVKAIIVDEAHRLSSAAWNVLLKPIEEPPAHVFWSFCTTEPGKIPKAIETRCLRYDLKPVSEEKLLSLLVKVIDAEKLEISDEIIETIAENSNGSPRQALVFLEECLYCETAGEARQLMRTAGQSKEIIDLCRWIISGQAATWQEALKYLKALEGTEAESARLIIVAYLTSVLMNTKDEEKAGRLFELLECFTKQYNSSERLAPLVYSVGMAIGMDGR